MTRLVLVPGIGLGPEAWEPTCRDLCARGMDRAEICVALLPGFGLPAARRDDLSPARLAQTLVDRWLPPGEVCLLVGHSASSQIVAHACLLAPERIGGLVLIGPTTDPRAATWPRLLRRWFATLRHEPFWQVPTLLRQYVRTRPVAMARALHRAKDDSIQHTLSQSSCPVRVVRGPDDRISPEDWASTLASVTRATGAETSTSRFTGHTSVVTLTSGAHMVPLTDGTLVAAAIMDFTRQIA